jgi:photosystem II stability/assembly factor-like uncharacterized protein
MVISILPKGLVYGVFLLLLFFTWSCQSENPVKERWSASPGEGQEMEFDRKQYFQLIHGGDLQVDWRAIESQNRQQILQNRQSSLLNNPNNVNELFANGKITASWFEIGSNNIAGNIQGIDYFAASDHLYCISDGGTLWRSSRTALNWVVLNQHYQFSPRLINVIAKQGGGTKIITSADKNIYYSDDEGRYFKAATGVNFPVAWGDNAITDIITLYDAQKTVYSLARVWDPGPWAPRFWLYRSIDTAKTFTRIKIFDAGSVNRLSLWSPDKSDKLFAMEVQNTGGSFVKLYGISGNSVALLNSSTDIPVDKECILHGFSNGSSTVFYLLLAKNQLYRSDNNGLNWTPQATLPDSYYGGFAVSPSDPNKVFIGGVDLHRSFNGGVNWNRVNGWEEYYSNLNKLHADIMRIKYFKSLSDEEFMVINTHGGTYLSYDNLLTTTNISLSNLNTGQFYDVITHPANVRQIYGGTQDQGFQRHIGASTPILSPISFTQVIPGDYGQLRFSENSSRLWTEYPGGKIDFYSNPNDLVSSSWWIPGANKPNAGWLPPTSNTAHLSENSIYVGGGNLSGGSGSYLIKLTVFSEAPFTITATQYNFDFRANSNNGLAGISAIASSTLSPYRIYAATEDGTFFYSHDNGINWLKSAFTGIPGGARLYGSGVTASKLSNNAVWFAGSGYSNPGVFKSTDGGINFAPMSDGLPPTLVHEIATNENETLLFAATEAGPYVFVVEDNRWYSLHGVNTPVQDYFTVEYLPLSKTARFGTYGRGIWDFAISSLALPVKFESISASLDANSESVQVQWTVSEEINVSAYHLQKSTDGIEFITIASFAPLQGSTGSKKYDFIDKQLSHPYYFYRVQEVDRDGKKNFSKTISVRIYAADQYKLWPTLVRSGTGISLQTPTNKPIWFLLFDGVGRLALKRVIQPGTLFYLDSHLPKGNYYYQLVERQKTVQSGALTIH